MKIFIDESLPLIDKLFNNKQFKISYFNKNTKELIEHVDVVICRAHTKISKKFLNGFKPRLIATASSGSDNLDKHLLKQNNISYIDAIGSNAISVCDYILHILHHHLLKIPGKKVGIIGVGNVGSKVDVALRTLGYETFLCDPIRANKESDFKSYNIEQLYDCNIITIHVPLEKNGKHKTEKLIDQIFLSKLKSGSIIINTSRGEVICESAMLNNNHLIYCLDVFQNEPNINPDIIKQCKFATPHIAGHAIEAKQRAIVMLHKKIISFLKLPKQQTNFDYLLKTKPSNLQYNFTYDPMLDTNTLKLTPSSDTFLKLRKSHTIRHELGPVDIAD